MDSRHYTISFALQSLSEVPSDFDLPFDLGALEAGVFLPQDDADWLGRRKYPARVFLLTEREAVVAAHPAAGEPLIRVPLNLIGSVECGRILLLGWIAFSWAGGNRNLPYNTRTRGPVEVYMERFMDRWLPAAPGPQERRHNAARKPLNLKFEYARSAALLPGEAPLVQFFRPVSCTTRRLGVLRRKTWSAGDLLMATSRRLLWITERNKGQYEAYGTVSHSVPLASIADLRTKWAADRGALEIVACSGISWHIPLRDGDEPEAREFEAALQGIL